MFVIFENTRQLDAIVIMHLIKKGRGGYKKEDEERGNTKTRGGIDSDIYQ